MNKGSLLEFLRNGDGRDLIFPELVYIAAQVFIIKYLPVGTYSDRTQMDVLVGSGEIQFSNTNLNAAVTK